MFKDLGVTLDNLIALNPISNEKLFALYDPVHILKNFRNNWINKKDNDKTIEFYHHVNGNREKHLAKFCHLNDLLVASENSPLTVSSKLTLVISSIKFRKAKSFFSIKDILCRKCFRP